MSKDNKILSPKDEICDIPLMQEQDIVPSTSEPTEPIGQYFETETIQKDAILMQGVNASVIICDSEKPLFSTDLMPLISEFLNTKPQVLIGIEFYFKSVQKDIDFQLREKINQHGEQLSASLNSAAAHSFWLMVKVFNNTIKRFRYVMANTFHIGNGNFLTARHCLATTPNETLYKLVVGKDGSLMQNVKVIDHDTSHFKNVFTVSVVEENTNCASFLSTPYDISFEDHRDVALLRISREFKTSTLVSLLRPSFLLPPIESNYTNHPIAIIGYTDHMNQSVLPNIESKFSSPFVDLLKMEEKEKMHLLGNLYRQLFKHGAKQTTTIGSIVFYDNSYIVTTAPAFEILSGSLIVSLEDPTLLLGILIGGRRNGFSIGLSYMHPVLRVLYYKGNE